MDVGIARKHGSWLRRLRKLNRVWNISFIKHNVTLSDLKGSRVFMPAEAVLTTEEVAERLQVGTNTILRWLRAGQLHGIKIARVWRVREGELEDSDIDSESREWLDADLGGELPPYDWGEAGVPKGKPVFYKERVGFVIKGGRD